MNLQAFDPVLGRTGRGLGQVHSLPANIHILKNAAIPANGQWMLAFVSGAQTPLVIVHGKSFGYQQTINYFAALGGGQTIYFAFTNNKGTYIFAYEYMNGQHVIKICTTGFLVNRTPGNHAPWTVYPSGTHAQRGLGAAAKSTYTGTITPQVPSPPTPYPPQVGEPPGNGLWWWQFQWRYIGNGGYPASPPSGLAPPNQPPSSTGEVGKWVNMTGNYWDWFPPGIQGAYGQIVGGDGVVYNVYASSSSAASQVAAGGPQGGTLPPPPAGPPPALPGYAGQWFNPHPAYWVFLPSAAPVAAPVSATTATGTMIVPATTTATTTTSSTWLWWLLGIAAVGGVAYWVMD